MKFILKDRESLFDVHTYSKSQVYVNPDGKMLTFKKG